MGGGGRVLRALVKAGRALHCLTLMLGRRPRPMCLRWLVDGPGELVRSWILQDPREEVGQRQGGKAVPSQRSSSGSCGQTPKGWVLVPSFPQMNWMPSMCLDVNRTVAACPVHCMGSVLAPGPGVGQDLP